MNKRLVDPNRKDIAEAAAKSFVREYPQSAVCYLDLIQLLIDQRIDAGLAVIGDGRYHCDDCQSKFIAECESAKLLAGG